MIKASQLVKSFGKGDLEITVLKEISLEINSGEFVAIIGPSGAGKSTLLYQLSLLDVPTAGDVFLDGIRTADLNERQKTEFRLKELGYVFQDYALLPELNALENVALPMLMQGMSKMLAFKKAEEALARVNLSDKMQNLPSALSGGQQQRVSIARAIVHHPHILFADEPTANLDSTSARPVIDTFLQLHKEGQTIVMVTHEEEYAKMAGRLISLKDGKIVSDQKQD
ncbi:MAG: ABC transporter [Candidatus Taylorbacteria bacterium RIFCSPHIGHO2_01_FULL_46_22b]|uniref:ABC transporter n=1 Tax=Candidatus Taylorbacteria bacterium RIFCSPHIGHO2_01_FULL_46_22b TaxID=1802301 RepID=A0A1G2M3L0_9BACT|nr:MAG: ABC transporter [Candidatus Taylorbacteria bacterium RIFCSPHIGHO2_01_FULL_46_22b]